MTEQKTENTLTAVALTGGVVSKETTQQVGKKITETTEKTMQFIRKKTPPLIKATIRSINRFRKSSLGRSLLRGVAYAALLSGYATTGAGHVIQAVDKAMPDFLSEAQKGLVNTMFEAGSNIGSFVYENAPIKEVIDDITPSAIQLTNAVKETIPSTIREPASHMGKRLLSFAHQESAKLIPDSLTQGKNAVPALKHYKESAGR